MTGDTTVTETPASCGNILWAIARAPKGQADPPEFVVRIAALAGGWSRKQARRRVRRVWPELQRELTQLEQDLGGLDRLDYIRRRRANEQEEGAHDLPW